MTSSPAATLNVFRHLGVENASCYRAILTAFFRAREGFVLQLRPDDVAAALNTAGEPVPDESALVGNLGQLISWGNLTRQVDRGRVQTIEQFNRPKYLYCLSEAGRAAEEALEYFHGRLGRRGALDQRALVKVSELLQTLEQQLAQAGPDAAADFGKTQDTLRTLTRDFEALTEEAQTFLLSLQGSIELQTLDLQAFLEYKQHLIHYLEDFVRELLVTAPRAAAVLGRIDNTRLDAVLDGLAEYDSRADPSGEPAVRARWQNRWNGVVAWFVAPRGQRSQAAELRRRAQNAIPALLAAVAGINDRRGTRSDRTHDLKTLARWFVDCPDDNHAHRLWRGVTTLPSARHLHLDPVSAQQRDEHPVRADTSWLTAPPLALTLTLRRTGEHRKRGPGPGVIARRAERARLRRAAQAQAQQLADARREIFTTEPTRLSHFAPLSPAAFGELLDLLGTALSRRVVAETPVTVRSIDGALTFHLVPTADGETCTLHTRAGTLTGPDFHVTVRETTHAPAVPA